MESVDATYYVHISNQTYGPADMATLKAWVDQGALLPTGLLWWEEKWYRIGELPAFETLFQQPTPAPKKKQSKPTGGNALPSDEESSLLNLFDTTDVFDPVFCTIHTDTEATDFCEKCGNDFCSACMLSMKGKRICVNCGQD